LNEYGDLRAAHVADALDGVGLRNQCLPVGIVQLSGEGPVIGRAFPVTAERVDHVPDEHYAGLLAARDAIGPNDVFVMSAQGRDDVALWGELVSTASQARGAVGAIIDGYVRDTEVVLQLGFGVFARGTHPTDIHGRLDVAGHGEPISVGDVTIERGALIVADRDGVVVVPTAVEAEVIATATAKASIEVDFRDAVVDGMAPSEAFKTFGVL
jgi:4-hydroxy-4-methyl-2-oxoglutarate aldolase